MNDETKEYWNREGPGHKKKAYGYGVNPAVRYPTYEVRRERVLELLADRKPGRLLDAGCGAGDVLLDLMVAQGWDGFGIDFAPNMVQAAGDALVERGFERSRISEGSITDLSVHPDRSFDVVICMGVLGYLPAPEQPKVYAEVRRVLKDDGVFLVQHVNGLFDLFTLNRFTVDFYRNRLLPEFFSGAELEQVCADTAALLARPDAPAADSKYASVRDVLPVTTEIPLAFAEKVRAYGFAEIDQVFTRFHSAPPLLFQERPELERAAIEHEKRLCRHWSARLTAAGFISVLEKA